MTQRSWPWPGTTVGDAGPYSADEWDDMFEMRFGSGAAPFNNMGVLPRWANELEVTDPVVANRVDVDTGAAIVHGKHYDNDAVVNVFVATSVGAWREDLICLRAVWALEYVQIARHSNPADGVAYPAPTQTDGVTWEIPLAAVRIDNAGVILSVTDLREYPRPNLDMGPYLYRRQGGSAAVWKTPGATSYVPYPHVRMQAGVASVTILNTATFIDTAALTFPVAFSQAPIMIQTVELPGGGAEPGLIVYLRGVTAAGWTARVSRTGAVGNLVVSIHWLAIGPV